MSFANFQTSSLDNVAQTCFGLAKFLTVHFTMEVFHWQCDWFTFRSWKVIATQLLIMIVTGSYTIFRKENWLCPFAKHCECTVFIGMLLSTHLFFKDSQLKQMNYRGLWFSVTRGAKQTEWPLQLSTHIFPRIHLRNEDQRSFFGKFPFLKE